MSAASILVVEDNADNMKLITWLLEDEGYGYTCAETAEEALAIMNKETFDLVLMDISLPGMDGKEATRRIRSQPQFASLPIIAVTAHAIRAESETILACGITQLTTKPIDAEQLISTIRTYLPEEVRNA